MIGVFLSAGTWVGALAAPAEAAPNQNCLPGTDELVAAIGSVAPSTSQLWVDVEGALSQGATNGGQAIQAVLSVLNKNNYFWDCTGHQLVTASGAPVPSIAGPASSAGQSGAASPAGAASGSGVDARPGAVASGAAAGSTATSGTSAGNLTPQQGGATPSQSTDGAATSSNANRKSAGGGSLASSTAPASGTADMTPWVVVALMLSTGLLVFVVARHFRKAHNAPADQAATSSEG
jgi:hypothetical protein